MMMHVVAWLLKSYVPDCIKARGYSHYTRWMHGIMEQA